LRASRLARANSPSRGGFKGANFDKRVPEARRTGLRRRRPRMWPTEPVCVLLAGRSGSWAGQTPSLLRSGKRSCFPPPRGSPALLPQQPKRLLVDGLARPHRDDLPDGSVRDAVDDPEAGDPATPEAGQFLPQGLPRGWVLLGGPKGPLIFAFRTGCRPRSRAATSWGTRRRRAGEGGDTGRSSSGYSSTSSSSV